MKTRYNSNLFIVAGPWKSAFRPSWRPFSIWGIAECEAFSLSLAYGAEIYELNCSKTKILEVSSMNFKIYLFVSVGSRTLSVHISNVTVKNDKCTYILCGLNPYLYNSGETTFTKRIRDRVIALHCSRRAMKMKLQNLFCSSGVVEFFVI